MTVDRQAGKPALEVERKQDISTCTTCQSQWRSPPTLVTSCQGLDNRKTIAIIIVEKNGKREALIASSLEKLPRSVEKAARGRYRFVRGTGNRAGNPKDKNDPEYTSYHHAEHAGISAALSSGYKVIAVYPSKPACGHCGGFRDLGFTVIDP